MAEYEVPESPESDRERVVGLIIAVIAVVLAIVSTYSHGILQDEIITHVDIVDQYNYFQAKKERRQQLELAADSLTLQRDRLSLPAQADADRLLTSYTAEETKLDADRDEIKKKADELVADSRYLARRAGVFDLAEIALQIAIVLCSISILTEQRLFVRMGSVLAVIGFVVAAWGYFLPR